MTETRALVLEHQSARRRFVFGTVVTATATIAGTIALALAGARDLSLVLVASSYMAIAGGIGLESLAVGSVRFRRAKRQLQALGPNLPKARLLT